MQVHNNKCDPEFKFSEQIRIPRDSSCQVLSYLKWQDIGACSAVCQGSNKFLTNSDNEEIWYQASPPALREDQKKLQKGEIIQFLKNYGISIKSFTSGLGSKVIVALSNEVLNISIKGAPPNWDGNCARIFPNGKVIFSSSWDGGGYSEPENYYLAHDGLENLKSRIDQVVTGNSRREIYNRVYKFSLPVGVVGVIAMKILFGALQT